MNCKEWFDQLYRYLDKDLDDIVWKDVEVHMKNCRPCCDRYDIEIQLRERLQKSCKFEACTEALKLRIKTIIAKF